MFSQSEVQLWAVQSAENAARTRGCWLLFRGRTTNNRAKIKFSLSFSHVGLEVLNNLRPPPSAPPKR